MQSIFSNQVEPRQPTLLKQKVAFGGKYYLQHERVRRMDKNGGVVLGGGLQAELGVGGAGVVREGDAGGQFAVVQ